MRKFRKSFTAQMLTIMLIICMVAGSLDHGFVMPVRAEEEISAEMTEVPAAEAETPEEETAGAETPEIDAETPEEETAEEETPETDAETPKEEETTEEETPETDAETPEEEADEEETPETDAETSEEEVTEEEELREATSLTAEVNGVEITVNAPEGAFPAEGELTLFAEEITDERLEQAKAVLEEKVLAENREFTAYRLFDITPLLDGEEVQPEKPVSVAFKNLELEKEDGTKIDVLAELNKETEKAAEQTETEEPEIALYHFEDEETAEVLELTTEEEAVAVEVEHFSWHLVATNKVSGEPYDWNYEDEGGEYTLDYILKNYNVFCSGDYDGTHVVGPMVVGGTTKLHGSLGGTTDGTGDYVHTVPSYLEGRATNEEPTSFPQIITARPELRLYVGWENHQSEKVRYNPYYYTDKDLAPEKMYVNFEQVFPNETDNGTLYGNENIQGSVKYYQNFNGFDANGQRVYKIDDDKKITKTQIDEIRTDPDNNWDNMQQGIVKYYDKESRVVAEERKGIVTYYDLEGNVECEVSVEDKNAIVSKEKYAYAISSKNNKQEKVNIRFRPGYNFTVESFENVFSVVYDYETAEEMSNTLTIITTEDTGAIVLPSIYKSVQDDVFGKDYMFSSIEKGPGFSVLWLAPNTTKVVVGFKTADATEGDTNGSKLVGHLVVPQADVVVGGGDYNGGIIAKNVDAATSGSEGHMWPFLVGAGTEGIKVMGQKTVDGQTPGESRKFKFQATLKKKGTDGEYREVVFTPQDDKIIPDNPWIQESDALGEFEFAYDDDLLEAGDYQIEIKECDLTENEAKLYTKDPSVYVGTFTIDLVNDGDTPPPVHISWKKYPDEKLEGEGEDVTLTVVHFNNATKSRLTVKKEWLDEDGNPIEDTSEKPKINVNLYRDSTPPEGHRVVLKLYSGLHPTESESSLFDTRVLGYVKKTEEGVDVQFDVNCKDTYLFGDGVKAVAGVWQAKLTRQGQETPENIDIVNTAYGNEIHDNPIRYSGIRGTIGTVKSDVEIAVYYYQRNAENGYGPDGKGEPTADSFSVSTEGTNWEVPTFHPPEDHLCDSVELNEENGWTHTWEDLAPRDENGYPYYYKVIESFDGIAGYEVIYTNNEIRIHKSDDPTITVTNKKTSRVNLKLVKQDAEENQKLLAGAEFTLKPKLANGTEGETLWFKKDEATGNYSCVDKDTEGATPKLTTGSGGFWKITGLDKGTYILEETKAPDGYEKEKRKVTITLDDTSSSYQYDGGTAIPIAPEGDETLQFDFTNIPGVELPETGSVGTDWFTKGGIALLGISMMILFFEMARRRKEDTR